MEMNETKLETLLHCDYTKRVPGNGYVYEVIGTSPPFRGFQGSGNTEDYKVVTVFCAEYAPTGMAYVVPLFDKLHKSYVQEKFDPQNRFSDVALDAVTVAINTVIGIDDE